MALLRHRANPCGKGGQRLGLAKNGTPPLKMAPKVGKAERIDEPRSRNPGHTLSKPLQRQ